MAGKKKTLMEQYKLQEKRIEKILKELNIAGLQFKPVKKPTSKTIASMRKITKTSLRSYIGGNTKLSSTIGARFTGSGAQSLKSEHKKSKVQLTKLAQKQKDKIKEEKKQQREQKRKEIREKQKEANKRFRELKKQAKEEQREADKEQAKQQRKENRLILHENYILSQDGEITAEIDFDSLSFKDYEQFKRSLKLLYPNYDFKNTRSYYKSTITSEQVVFSRLMGYFNKADNNKGANILRNRITNYIEAFGSEAVSKAIALNSETFFEYLERATFYDDNIEPDSDKQIGKYDAGEIIESAIHTITEGLGELGYKERG